MGAYVEWGALGNIIVFGLIIGAGLPTLYALGVRALDSASRAAGRTVAVYKAGAVACFAVIAFVILGALWYIAARGH